MGTCSHTLLARCSVSAILSALCLGGWRKTRQVFPYGVLGVVAAAAALVQFLGNSSAHLHKSSPGTVAESAKESADQSRLVPETLEPTEQLYDIKPLADQKNEHRPDVHRVQANWECEKAVVKIQAMWRDKLAYNASVAPDLAALRVDIAALKARFDDSGEIGIVARAAYQSAMRVAPAYVTEGWERQETGSVIAPGVNLYRKSTAAVVRDPTTNPFKVAGVIKGVSPMTLAMIATEKQADVQIKTEAGGECKVLRHLDWQTTVWYERDKYPQPLAERESVFCIRWEVREDGNHVRIVQCPVDLTSHPITILPLRTKTFIVHEMRAAGEDTEWTICLEFNAGGSLPTRVVSNFVHGQSNTFAHVSAYFATESGAARKEAWDQKLRMMSRDPTHPLHAM